MILATRVLVEVPATPYNACAQATCSSIKVDGMNEIALASGLQLTV